MALEIIAGFFSHSLALLADAGHMATDVVALGMSLAAFRIARRPATRTKTFGFYRAEILAAFLNGLTLCLIVVWIVYEAFHRLIRPPIVQAPMMLMTAIVGLAANLGCSWVLQRSQGQSLNLRGAYLHVLADAVSSAGVIAAAVVIWATGWHLADPLAGFFVCIVILWGSWNLIAQSVNILLEGTPAHIDAAEVARAMREVAGVHSVHDVHIWTITSGMEAMSAHVVAGDLKDSQEVLGRLNALLCDRFQIHHTTIQLERVSTRRPHE
jgi:cobalt-zinc-cadmium efflux system protein